jgi:hypothetical protein
LLKVDVSVRCIRKGGKKMFGKVPIGRETFEIVGIYALFK